jgi:hypothetical protein
MVSDNGTEFVNNTMKQFHGLLLSKRLTTTPFNPQSNGSVEIFNRTLADMLCAYVYSNQNNWPRYLPIIAHAYRTTVNSATGYSPFRAIYGREARQPSDSWIQDFTQLHDVPIDTYVEELQYILSALKNDIFINELKINWNLFFFKAVKYALTEQKLLDWAFKTSFINVVNNAGLLDQRPVYKLSNTDYYEQYLEEVKPEETKTEETKSDEEVKPEETKTED